jgi:hypothetical protein
LLARAARALLSSGLQPLNPLLLIELACQKMQKTKRGKDDVVVAQVFPKAQMQAQLQ